MSTRWISFFLAIIALIIFSWFYKLQHVDDSESLLLSEGSQTQMPSYVGKNVQAKVFAKNGDVLYEAQANKVIHFNSNGLTYFQHPMFILFDNKDNKVQKAWKVIAQQAILNKAQIVQLQQDVRVINLQPDPIVDSLQTALAWVNLKNYNVYSRSPTKILGSQLQSFSEQFSGNLKKQQLTLEKQVKSHYEFKQ